MASEWETYEIGEIADVVGGGTPSTKDTANFDGGIPWLTPKDLSLPHGRYVSGGERTISEEGLRRSSARLMPAGTVLLSTRAPVGYVAIAAGEMTTNQGFRSLVLKDGFLPEFVYYWLLQNTEELERHASGSTFRELSGSALKRIKIRTPPLPEQRAIAHILGTLDDKIELNRRMARTLEEMARALFKAWFVDFEPVRAKMEGRWRPGESLPGLPAHLYDLFPDRLVDSELGPIPEGWEVGRLGDVAEHPRRGVRPSDMDAETPYIGLEHMPRRSIALSDWGSAGAVASNKFEFKRGEILFGKLRPYFHKVGVAPVDGVCSTDIVVLKPRDAGWFAYLLSHVSHTAFIEFTSAGSTGTRMPRTSWSQMARYPLVLPPRNVATAFLAHVQPAVDQVLVGIHESRVLASLRDALLPKLVSGEVRVTDPDRILAEVGQSDV